MKSVAFEDAMKNFFNNHVDNIFEKSEEKKQHSYIRHIPDGYQYCNNCEALTPHTLNSQINPSKSICTDFTCDICDSVSEGYDSCPRCGWDFDPENNIMPEVIKDKKHTVGCLNKQEAENDADLRADIWNNCDCPEVDVYPISNCYNYKERSVFSMDCSNAMEWSYDVICEKCNYIFEVEDGNC